MSPTTPPNRERPIPAVDRQGVGTPRGIRPADVPRRLWRGTPVTPTAGTARLLLGRAFLPPQ